MIEDALMPPLAEAGTPATACRPALVNSHWQRPYDSTAPAFMGPRETRRLTRQINSHDRLRGAEAGIDAETRGSCAASRSILLHSVFRPSDTVRQAAIIRPASGAGWAVMALSIRVRLTR
jgi:hypothetical protein